MTAPCKTIVGTERGNWLAMCSCGWLRAAPDETTARGYARKHEPREKKEGA